MILVISIGLVFALAVGGFVMAANIYGDQDQSPIDSGQQIVMDCFDPAETAQLQALREPDFVMESESGCWDPFNTVQGYITWDSYFFPEELPLCITTEIMADWYVMVLSYGGYMPVDGYITVSQKFEEVGKIYIEWTDMGKGDFDCCNYVWWKATFSVEEKFCLDSNQYPMCSGIPGYIPDKEVFFCYDTTWSGCGEEYQHFTMIHSHSYRAFSKSYILTLQTQIPNPPKTPKPQNISFHFPFGNISEHHMCMTDSVPYAVLQPRMILR